MRRVAGANVRSQAAIADGRMAGVGRSRPDAPAAQRTASLPVADFHRRPGRLLPDRRPIETIASTHRAALLLITYFIDSRMERRASPILSSFSVNHWQ